MDHAQLLFVGCSLLNTCEAVGFVVTAEPTSALLAVLVLGNLQIFILTFQVDSARQLAHMRFLRVLKTIAGGLLPPKGTLEEEITGEVTDDELTGGGEAIAASLVINLQGALRSTPPELRMELEWPTLMALLDVLAQARTPNAVGPNTLFQPIPMYVLFMHAFQVAFYYSSGVARWTLYMRHEFKFCIGLGDHCITGVASRMI